MDKYENRQAAGKALAQALKAYHQKQDIIVLALPRGGVPVAFEVAKALHAPLDVFIVRKLGVPGNPELAMGAIASGHAIVFNEDIVRAMGVTKAEIQTVVAREQAELLRRETAYRDNRPAPVIEHKTVILVDDGIATGASMRVAIQALRQQLPTKIIVAVPVAEKSMCDEIETRADAVICLLRPTDLHAVGVWYQDFSQTEDDEVRTLLKKAEASL